MTYLSPYSGNFLAPRISYGGSPYPSINSLRLHGYHSQQVFCGFYPRNPYEFMSSGYSRLLGQRVTPYFPDGPYPVRTPQRDCMKSKPQVAEHRFLDWSQRPKEVQEHMS